MSRHCWNDFQGHRSKLKVIAMPNALPRRRPIHCHGVVSRLVCFQHFIVLTCATYRCSVLATSVYFSTILVDIVYSRLRAIFVIALGVQLPVFRLWSMSNRIHFHGLIRDLHKTSSYKTEPVNCVWQRSKQISTIIIPRISTASYIGTL